MIRRTALAALIAASLFAGSFARADVPPPPGAPPSQGASPGTGGPGGGGPIPPPPGTTGDDGGGTTTTPPSSPPGSGNLPPVQPPSDNSCNPEYPDPSVNNTPGSAWYSDMYQQIYYTNYYFQQISEWAYGEYMSSGDSDCWDMYVNAGYMSQYMNEYYWNYYSGSGQPNQYSWGYASRGDFNYDYYYWVRPVYFQFLESAGRYYQRNYGEPNFNYSGYQSHVYNGMVRYHELTLCEYGKNGKDAKAKDDDKAYAAEKYAGIPVTRNEVLQ